MSSAAPDGGTPWEGELLLWKGGTHYQLLHHLGSVPAWWHAYLSFDRFGTRDGGQIAEVAGNQVVLLGLDATSITVANDSCVDYWLMVVAGAAGTVPPPGP
jgi:hypothetical protein